MPPKEVDEPYARKPRRSSPKPTGDWNERQAAISDDGLLDITAMTLDGVILDLSGIHRLDIEDCVLNQVSFEDIEPDLEVRIARTTVERSDLSRLRIATARQSLFSSGKLVGTDFSDGLVQDCEFNDCVVRLTNFRMATIRRTRFTGCTLEEVDAYSAEFEDLAFTDSDLREFNVDAVAATRIDLRGCKSLEITGISRLDGFLVSDVQLPALAYQLANVVGLQVDG